MLSMFAAIVGIDPLFEFCGTQQAVGFRNGSLPMDPFWFIVKEFSFCGSLKSLWCKGQRGG
jgi:hypothetical protein